MILVSDIFEASKKIFGHCNEKLLFRQITDSIELLAGKGETNALMGFVDLCTFGKCVTLPREVETVIAVSLCGRPAASIDQLFEYHINSGGSGCSCKWGWVDGGEWPTYKDIICPSKLVAFLDNPQDAGKILKVFGFDQQNRPLRTEVNGVWQDGYLVPTIYGYALPDANAPLISRITGIVKDLTVANVRLSSFDGSSTTGTLIGVYEPDETIPAYRRIKISPCSPWIRVAYRKRTYEVRSVNDRILIDSRPALLLAMTAFHFYEMGDIANANVYEANAARLLTEKERSYSSPTRMPVQVEGVTGIGDERFGNGYYGGYGDM